MEQEEIITIIIILVIAIITIILISFWLIKVQILTPISTTITIKTMAIKVVTQILNGK